MSGFTHKALRVPVGMLTHEKIQLPFRLMLYFSQGPVPNYVSARKLACIMGMDMSTPAKAEKAATVIRVTRSRLVTDGLLERLKGEGTGGNDSYRVIIPDAPQSTLDMLGSLDCNVYVNASEEEKATGHAVSIKLPKTAAKGWDCIPWYGSEEHFTNLMPFAFSTDRKQLHFFWNGFCARVTSIMKKSKTKLPAAVVSMMVLMWTANQIRKNGYPPTIKSQGGYVLKTMIGRDFPVALLKNDAFIHEALKVLSMAEGTPALRAYLRDNDTTKVAQFSMTDADTEVSTGPIQPLAPDSRQNPSPEDEEPAEGTVERSTEASEDDVDDDMSGWNTERMESMLPVVLEQAPELTPDQKHAEQAKREEERWLSFRDDLLKCRGQANELAVARGKDPEPLPTDEELMAWYLEEYPESLVTE